MLKPLNRRYRDAAKRQLHRAIIEVIRQQAAHWRKCGYSPKQARRLAMADAKVIARVHVLVWGPAVKVK